MLRCDRIGKSFGPRMVLKSVTLSVGRGEIVCLCGPSGWGKSTILNIAAGVMEPDTGTCTRTAGRIGYAFQKDLLLPWRNCRDNLLFVLEPLFGRADASRRADEWLATVGLASEAASFPGELSGGMRKRLAVARAMSVEPELLLLDEPFAYLDGENVEMVKNLVKGILAGKDCAVMLVTHTPEHARDLGSTIIDISVSPVIIEG